MRLWRSLTAEVVGDQRIAQTDWQAASAKTGFDAGIGYR
jgi:hypothetical protein